VLEKLLPENRIVHNVLYMALFLHPQYTVCIDYIRMPQWQKNTFYVTIWEFFYVYMISLKKNQWNP